MEEHNEALEITENKLSLYTKAAEEVVKNATLQVSTEFIDKVKNATLQQ